MWLRLHSLSRQTADFDRNQMGGINLIVYFVPTALEVGHPRDEIEP